MEGAPELLRHLLVHVHTYEHVGGAEFLEGMSDAVGDVGSHTYLRGHGHVGRCGVLCHAVEQLLSLLLMAAHVFVVVNHVQTHERCRVLGVAHHHSHVHEALGILRILHRDENLLFRQLRVFLVRYFLVAQRNLLCGLFRNHGRYDAREENHYDDAVEHVVIDERLSGRCLDVHANHQHGYGSSRVCRRQTEHHVAR